MMQSVKLYNTLTRQKEEYKPLFDDYTGLYTCGPTVYNYAHIGNLRTYLFQDVLKRVLLYNDFNVKHVMNITDVGHLTGDRDMGEDKLEKGAAREGKSAWDIAEFYTKAFQDDLKALNILDPDVWCKATDSISEQIELIQTLEEKGYTYKINDGIYFDTSKIEDYTKLSNQNLDALQEGARVEKNIEKRNATDFALWKFSPKDQKRQMEWESPWGIGFPGWHIECSAMSMMYLKDHLDIHCGGIDHIDVHHTNEIAQSEAATGEDFFKFWMHGAFLNITGGKKMAKSEGNFLTLASTFIDNDISPLVYRFASFQTHYRKPMEYSDEAIESATNGYNHLKNQVRTVAQAAGDEKADVHDGFKEQFMAVINDDLNMLRAMAVIQDVLKSDLTNAQKYATVLDFDQVTGLKLDKVIEKEVIPPEIQEKVDARIKAREDKNWALSDQLRDEIQALGYIVQDSKEGMKVIKQ
ncbi:MAG: cysteine--tRNA ligase [Desulfobacterales bacterium]|nr:cysteine--tRNA ligase [Desulfobacterales bacterium]